MRRFAWFCLILFAISSADAERWVIREREGIALHVAAADSARAEGWLRDLFKDREEVCRKLGGVAPVPMTVYVAPTQRAFDVLTQDRLPHWSAAVAFPHARKMVLKRTSRWGGDWRQTVRHEMAHILLHAAISAPVPVWFHEGLAMWVSQEWRLTQTAAVFHAVFAGGLIPLSKIDSVLAFGATKADLAYTESLLAMVYLIHLGGQNTAPDLVAALESGTPFDVALFRVTGETVGGFERRWADYVRGRFSLAALLASPDALWLYLVGLLFLAFLAVKLRNRAVMRRWEREEDLEDLPLRFRLRVHRREDEP